MLLMKKKKTIEINLPKEKFVIPQINYSLDGILKSKSKFVPSEIASPIHGTNVLDKKHYVDNSGVVDIDYGYDFLRDEKHISDEELIRRHGTKYHEFTFVNDQFTEEQKRGSDYSKKTNKVYNKPEEKVDVLSNFFEDVNDLEEQILVSEPINENVEEPIDLEDESLEFKIKFNIDDEDDSYEYNSFDDHLPKPDQTTPTDFLHWLSDP